ncbi:LCP2 [Symbiodinium sp. CCMP2456]|nr:LCP2 [Symbiodinium sp. CCMP2456]
MKMVECCVPKVKGTNFVRNLVLLPGLRRKAGANFGDLAATADPGLATDRIIHAIDGLRKAQDEDKTGTKGQLSALKEGEKLDVFLARGCGQLSVELCKDVYGKELFHSIKRAGHHAKHSLGLIKWPVLITNRVALAVAGLWWGGSESFTLLASDCVTARTEQVEAWDPPTEHKIEGRVKERMKFLQALQEAHEEDEHAVPFKYCMDLYEELSAVWCEGIRERRRQLCAKLGTENPRLEDLKLIALAPGPDGNPNFQFPRVWDLSGPSGYYQRVILPRQDHAMARLLNKQLHDHVTRDRRPDHRKTAGPEDREGTIGAPPDSDEGKSGRAPRLALRTEDPKTGGIGDKAYPAGKRLTPTEVKRSITHAAVCQKYNASHRLLTFLLASTAADSPAPCQASTYEASGKKHLLLEMLFNRAAAPATVKHIQK